MMTTTMSDEQLDRFRTFNEAAELIQLPYFKIQRAARQGVIPTYAFFNARKYVKLRDIFNVMSPTQN